MTLLNPSIPNPIDAVVTWVNSEDPQWQIKKKKFQKNPLSFCKDSTNPNRFQNRNELKYVLRSIDQYMPWIRWIFIVTDHQIPEWIMAHEKIKFIDHDQILDKNKLPVFNSMAIESALCYISELSEHFIYFNDDTFLNQKTEISDFFYESLPVVYLSEELSPKGIPKTTDRSFEAALKQSNLLLDTIENASPNRLKICHGPSAQLKSFCKATNKNFADSIQKTQSNRFRSVHCVATTNHLYPHSLLIQKKAISVPWQEAVISFTENSDGNFTAFKKTLQNNPLFFCIQDDTSLSAVETQKQLEFFLDLLYPFPSPWELQNSNKKIHPYLSVKEPGTLQKLFLLQEFEINSLKNQFQRIQNTLSWKITHPLRFIFNLFKFDLFKKKSLQPEVSPQTASHSPRKKTILVADQLVPVKGRDGGSQRMFDLLNLLSSWFHIIFISQHLSKNNEDYLLLNKIGIECSPLLTLETLPSHLSKNNLEIEKIVLSRTEVVDFYFTPLKNLYPHAEFIFDTCDLYHLREERRLQLQNKRGNEEKQNALQLKKKELLNIQHSDQTWVVSEFEYQYLHKKFPEKNIQIVSHVHPVFFQNSDEFKTKKDLLFIGNFLHAPNVDAIEYFHSEIWPLLKNKEPEIKLHIVGQYPPQHWTTLFPKNFILHGRLGDTEPLFKSARVFIAPLRFGAGIKFKIGEALSYGLPVVTTSIGSEGFGFNNQEVKVADHAPLFCDLTLEIYQNESLWLKTQAEGLRFIQKYSESAMKVQLKKCLNIHS